jgi:hypothetical protein
VVRYWHPDEYARVKEIGAELGFTHVEAGPFVRSSYHAGEQARAAGMHAPGNSNHLRPASGTSPVPLPFLEGSLDG